MPWTNRGRSPATPKPQAPSSRYTTTKRARRRRGSSSHRFLALDPLFLPLPSRHHPTALPSPKRYDNRYEAATYGSISPRLGDVEKPSVDHRGLLHSAYSAYLWAIKREPTSGLKNRLPLLQLRVCGQGLLGVAEDRKSRIDKGFSIPCIARCCRVLHAG